MTDFIDVVEHNPITFVKTIVEKLAEGYVVKNNIQGYPHFGSYGNLIRLFKGELPSGVVIPADTTGLVQHYDPMHFMLMVQSLVQAGYRFKEDGDHFFDEKGLKSVQLEIPQEKPEVKKEEKPAKKAPAKKALKAEPTKSEMEETNDGKAD